MDKTLTPDDPRHGKYSTYTNYNCRCELCTAAIAEYSRNRSASRTAKLKELAAEVEALGSELDRMHEKQNEAVLLLSRVSMFADADELRMILSKIQDALLGSDAFN